LGLAINFFTKTVNGVMREAEASVTREAEASDLASRGWRRDEVEALIAVLEDRTGTLQNAAQTTAAFSKAVEESTQDLEACLDPSSDMRVNLEHLLSELPGFINVLKNRSEEYCRRADHLLRVRVSETFQNATEAAVSLNIACTDLMTTINSHVRERQLARANEAYRKAAWSRFGERAEDVIQLFDRTSSLKFDDASIAKDFGIKD